MRAELPAALGVARARTVAFSGIDVKDVDVQVQISAGLPAFTIAVGLGRAAAHWDPVTELGEDADEDPTRT